MNIYVGNLPYSTGEEDLKSIFGEYGEIESVKIITDKYSGRSKGFGFVVMENDSEAKTAIENLNGKTVDNREITVNEARPRNDNFSNNR
ncbi:MAG: RNA-binding protein [Marinilabiliaceae bacterium]|nr:RNA-binding protein [Marinilabiliaceae bacterium]